MAERNGKFELDTKFELTTGSELITQVDVSPQVRGRTGMDTARSRAHNGSARRAIWWLPPWESNASSLDCPPPA